MKEIPLTRGKTALVSDEDYEIVSKYKWCALKSGYAVRCIQKNHKRTTIYMHRFILGAKYGQEIDHIDGDKSNNQRENLRFCDHSHNLSNRTKQKNNSSGFKGVTWAKRFHKWQAQITVKQHNIWLGFFDNPLDASKTYQKAAIKYFGEFACNNKMEATC